MDEDGVPGRAPRQDQLLEEASLWFARMRGPDAETYRPQFEQWLQRGAAHRGAYNRAGEVFALGKFMAETPDAESIDARNRPEPLIHWKTVAIVACLLLLFGLVAWTNRDRIAAEFGYTSQIAARGQSPAVVPVRIEAGQSQQRTVNLADGSSVVLEAGSVLMTNFSIERRELRLERGQARFEVAHERRPFIVLAGSGSVTARGTIFDVIVNHANGVTVRLLRGAVDVVRTTTIAANGERQPVVTRLVPGETLSFGVPALPSLATRDGPKLAADAERPTNEAVEFEKTPLAQIVAQTNQGATLTIRIADPAIGNLQVSGRFRIDDPAQVADRLASLFDLKAERVSGNQIVLRAR